MNHVASVVVSTDHEVILGPSISSSSCSSSTSSHGDGMDCVTEKTRVISFTSLQEMKNALVVAQQRYVY